jgi:hypothetical protein
MRQVCRGALALAAVQEVHGGRNFSTSVRV